MLRLQPPGDGANASRTFALRALFDERAGESEELDEAGFVELCRAACRHPLVASPSALERELRRPDALALDELLLIAVFRKRVGAGGALDADGARACLASACQPAWPARALAAPAAPADDDFFGADDDDDATAFGRAGIVRTFAAPSR